MTEVIRAPSILLQGEPGAGKTTALATLAASGLELFVVITEPGGEASLIAGCEMYDVSLNKVHWHYIPPATTPWSSLKAMARKINTQTYEDLAGLKSGIEKTKFQQFIELLSVLSDFKCDRTGESYGAVDTWGPERALAIDSLTGISIMSWNLTVGLKPTAHMGEWGVAMNAIERLLEKLCSDLDCFFALTGHLDRETDEITQSTKLMVGTLGRKLAPKIPRLFDESILVRVKDGKFLWTTSSNQAVVKSRSLPLKAELSPTFKPIIKKYHERRKVAVAEAGPTVKAVVEVFDKALAEAESQ